MALGTNYGLGVNVTMAHGRRRFSHGGEVSGFTAQNIVFPDDRVAVVVLVNQDAASTAARSLPAFRLCCLRRTTRPTAAKLEQAKEIFEGLQDGKI